MRKTSEKKTPLYRLIQNNVYLNAPSPRLKKRTPLDMGPQAILRSGTVIYEGTKIGARLETGHHTVIREENNIGDDFCLWNNATIDYGCHIGNRVKIHCNCYVAQFTTMEDDVFLAPGVTIANDLYPGIQQSARKMKGPYLEKNVHVGVNATILPYVRIGQGALIGSGAVVTKDVPPHTVMAGNPARALGTSAALRKKWLQKLSRINHP